MSGDTYTLMPSDVLTVTVMEPTTVELVSTPDKAKFYNKTEAQTIAGLRARVGNLERTVAAQQVRIRQLESPEEW